MGRQRKLSAFPVQRIEKVSNFLDNSPRKYAEIEIFKMARVLLCRQGMKASPKNRRRASEEVAVAGRRLDELGDKYGSIFKMRFADGYSESEIAQKLHLNVATVKTRAYRARAALRNELAAAS